jgi:hypothetical protein
MTRSQGRCHCGAVRFDADGAPSAVLVCNCSICTMKGYLHWIVPTSAFRLLTPEEVLSTYTFNTGVAKHHFCSTCGVSPFYIPRSDPDKVDINARCLEGIDLDTLERVRFEGRDWERGYQEYREGDEPE